MAVAVAVVGSLNFDTRLSVATLPGRGETVIAGASSTSVGGKGANQAAAAASLSPDVSMIGRVGDDDAANIMLDDLRARGADVTGVRRTPGVPSGAATVVVEDRGGENLIIVAPGANGELTPDDVDVPTVHTASVVLLQLEVPLATVARAVACATGMVVVNPAPPAELPIKVLQRVDVLVPNEWELVRLHALLHGAEQSPDAPTLEAAEHMARTLGARNVVVTLGARGALVVPADGPAELVASPRVDAVDTTGAGDCFCGALSVALAQGSPLVAATRFAVAAAAISTTGHGARGNLPDAAAVLATTSG